MNILEQANEIVNKRSEEKERAYGPFSEGMERAAMIMRGTAPAYEKAASGVAKAANLDNDDWQMLSQLARDHGIPEHIRISLLAIRSVLPGIDVDSSTSRIELSKAVTSAVAKKGYNPEASSRCGSIMSLVDPMKYEDIMLVASADSPTTRNQA